MDILRYKKDDNQWIGQFKILLRDLFLETDDINYSSDEDSLLIN